MNESIPFVLGCVCVTDKHLQKLPFSAGGWVPKAGVLSCLALGSVCQMRALDLEMARVTRDTQLPRGAQPAPLGLTVVPSARDGRDPQSFQACVLLTKG